MKLQTLIDEEMEDTTFTWNPDSNFINITEDIFWINPEVQGSQTPKPVTWSWESPQTPLSQKMEQSTVVVPLWLDLVQIRGEYTPQNEDLHSLIMFQYNFVQ
jgi:hypothetical protein